MQESKFEVDYANLNDLPEVIRIAKPLQKEGVLGRSHVLDEVGGAEVLKSIIIGDKRTFIPLVLRRKGQGICGLLFGIIAKMPFSEQTYSQEVLFFVEPEDRCLSASNLLLNAYEAICEKNSVSFIGLICPYGSRIGKLYERRGYSPKEVTYIKESPTPYRIKDTKESKGAQSAQKEPSWHK